MAERKIGSREFRVDRPLATDALRLQARLMRAAGGFAEKLPAILASRRDGASEAEKEQANVDALGAITGIFAQISPDEYASLVGEVVSMAKIKRPSGQYDEADLDGDFSESIGELIPLVIFVLRETFGDFFSGALASGARAAKVRG